MEADLQLGRHAKLTGELEALVAAHPTRERLTGQLMTALYRAGRQAEALDAYQRTRTHLAAELGLEPGPALKTLQAQILAQSPTLELATSPAASRARGAKPSTRPRRPRRLDSRRLVAVLAARADVGDPEALHGVVRPLRHAHRAARRDRRAPTSAMRSSASSAWTERTTTTRCGPPGPPSSCARQPRPAARDRVRRALPRAGIARRDRRHRHRHQRRRAPCRARRRGARSCSGAVARAIGAAADVDADSGALRDLRAERPALLRRPETPFVGRARELEALHAAFRESRHARVCRLVTVVGPPGIGKSRLAGEFLASVGPAATVLTGRCLAYGEGTTYRAIVDIVRGLGGDPRAQVQALLGGDEPAVRGILTAIGVSEEPAQVEETAWALRQLLTAIAGNRSLIVAIEDIHWAQPALLDVLDHLVALSSGTPILLVCLTRPELLETHPAWAMPQPHRAVLVLDALAGEQAHELAQGLGAGERAARIAQRAEGNPLFVEQLVAVGAAGETDDLPASMQAVLAARIDRLDEPERALLQSAAVEGRTFHAGALAGGLAEDERPRLRSRLVGLARKGLIGADQPEFPGEEAFRFTHALIREAAYAGLSKRVRAELHAGIARWLEERPTAADEIVGYHLEQACRLEGEAGGTGTAAGTALATRAVQRLRRAARAALTRGDPGAASALLERATRCSIPTTRPASRCYAPSAPACSRRVG